MIDDILLNLLIYYFIVGQLGQTTCLSNRTTRTKTPNSTTHPPNQIPTTKVLPRERHQEQERIRVQRIGKFQGLLIRNLYKMYIYCFLI